MIALNNLFYALTHTYNWQDVIKFFQIRNICKKLFKNLLKGGFRKREGGKI